MASDQTAFGGTQGADGQHPVSTFRPRRWGLRAIRISHRFGSDALPASWTREDTRLTRYPHSAIRPAPDAAKTDVRGRGVLGLRRTRGRPVAQAVLRRAQVRSALQDPAGTLARDGRPWCAAWSRRRFV